MRRKFKWHILKVKWEHRVNFQLKEELLRVNEYVENILVCIPEHVPLISENNEEIEEKTTEDLNHMKYSKEQEDLVDEASSERVE